MKVNKFLRAMQIKTTGDTHVVIRTVTGKKIVEMDLAGAGITITVPSNTEIKIKPGPGAK